MDKNLKELMQKSIVNEFTELSDMIKDIIPTKEQRFTNLELEAEKKQEYNRLYNFLKTLLDTESCDQDDDTGC